VENTIFFGNGINRLIQSNISWAGLLDKIKAGKKFEDNNLPNTMIYERIVLQKINKHDNILDDEYEVKVEIANLLENIEANDIYRDLFLLNVENYITTNYDYGFITSIKSLPEVTLPIAEYSTEDVYSIRRLKKISNTMEKKKNFWQIHGEIRRPATIMLGLDQYCGALGKTESYVKGTYSYQVDGEPVKELTIEQKFETGGFNGSSWIELIFTANIHIMGFTFDFSEVDLWWILTRRARMKKSPHSKSLIKNRIDYYCDKIDDQKKSLLESLFVNVHINPLSGNSDQYISHYRELIQVIKRKL